MGDSIASHVESCLDLFHLVTDQVGNASDATETFWRDISDERTRFKVWAGNIGAHNTGMSSLDYRLRDSSHIRTHVIRLLQDLDELLEDALAIVGGYEFPWDQISDVKATTDQHEGTAEIADKGISVMDPNWSPSSNEEDSTESELDQISVDVVDVVNCLLRLSAAIRNPAPHDRFAASHFTDTSHYELFDIRHVQSKFNDIDAILAERLGKAISRRRQYFKYREAHHMKLSRGLDLHRAADATTTAGSADPQTYQHHVGRHQEQLALFALPIVEMDDEVVAQAEVVDGSEESTVSSKAALNIEALEVESVVRSLEKDVSTNNQAAADNNPEEAQHSPAPSPTFDHESSTPSTNEIQQKALDPSPSEYIRRPIQDHAGDESDEVLITPDRAIAQILGEFSYVTKQLVDQKHQPAPVRERSRSRTEDSSAKQDTATSPKIEDIVSVLNKIRVPEEGQQGSQKQDYSETIGFRFQNNCQANRSAAEASDGRKLLCFTRYRPYHVFTSGEVTDSSKELR
ncbi:hypothetical protein VFPBJ_01570 [Purpureocillium lilacinum]|uniref:Prion-inhibition and propagation HeLo domain-containing protein n=1 Tax=Purpureocillium lilacinum TaxID=33203 RepID=A0A179HDB9_PURLI|nr:hypothetical protein VFPBJ_01570 [Purpureocillium lilacinum]